MAQGTMERITALVKSNLNEALDRVEDPVKMVDQIVRDVEDSVDQAIAALGRAKASERRCEREVQRNTEAIRGWWTKAEKAVRAGDRGAVAGSGGEVARQAGRNRHPAEQTGRSPSRREVVR